MREKRSRRNKITFWFRFCFVLFGGLVFRVPFPFVHRLCTLLHEIHALLWFVPILKAEVLALSVQIRLCVCGPADLREPVKGWPSQTQAGDCLAVNSRIKKLKLPASASTVFFLLLYSVCFSKCTTFSKAVFPSCLSTEMFMLLCISLPGTGTLKYPYYRYRVGGCSRNGLRIF